MITVAGVGNFHTICAVEYGIRRGEVSPAARDMIRDDLDTLLNQAREIGIEVEHRDNLAGAFCRECNNPVDGPVREDDRPVEGFRPIVDWDAVESVTTSRSPRSIGYDEGVIETALALLEIDGLVSVATVLGWIAEIRQGR